MKLMISTTIIILTNYFKLFLVFCSKNYPHYFSMLGKTDYIVMKNSIKVKTTKTILYYIFQYLVRWIAPTIPFTAEEAWQSWREKLTQILMKVVILLKLEPSESWEKDDLDELWQKIFIVKDLFSLCVEKKRVNKEIKNQVLK